MWAFRHADWTGLAFGVARLCGAGALALALSIASGCETETRHTTPQASRNPPPPPERVPRAIEIAPGPGVHLLSNEISDEEAEKLEQGQAPAEASGEDEAGESPQDPSR